MLSFASVNDGIDSVASLVNALVKASERDPYLEALDAGGAHCDGWGCSVVVGKKDSLRLFHYKTITPIYEDNAGVEKLMDSLKEAEVAMGLVHSRKASRGEPVTWLDAHPFHTVAIDSAELFLAHNGSVKKEELARILGMPTNRSDSLILAEYIARSSSDKIAENIRHVIRGGLVRSALNLGALILRPGGDTDIITCSYHVYEERDPSRERYYLQYLVRGEGFTAVVSSTIVDYYAPDTEHERVQVGTLLRLRVDNGRVLVETL